MKGKTREKFVCEGRLVAVNVEMARVAMAEHGNFVCEFHWHHPASRASFNFPAAENWEEKERALLAGCTGIVCLCPLASHSSTSYEHYSHMKYSTKQEETWHHIDHGRGGVLVVDETPTVNFHRWARVSKASLPKKGGYT